MSEEYKCPRCGYTTRLKHRFISHLHRKKPCTPVLEDISLSLLASQFNEKLPKEYECPSCSRSFASRSALAYHTSKCTPSEMHQLKKQIEENEKQIATLTEAVNKISHSTIINGDNNTISNTTNHVIHIHLRDFGQENIEHITQEFARYCLSLGHHGIVPMIDKIYFDADHPENHNVHLQSLKHGVVEVHKNSQWVPQGMTDTIDTMINTSTKHIISTMSPSISTDSTHDMIANVASIADLKPSHKKNIREKTKGRLLARRKFKTP